MQTVLSKERERERESSIQKIAMYRLIIDRRTNSHRLTDVTLREASVSTNRREHRFKMSQWKEGMQLLLCVSYQKQIFFSLKTFFTVSIHYKSQCLFSNVKCSSFAKVACFRHCSTSRVFCHQIKKVKAFPDSPKYKVLHGVSRACRA